MAKVKASEFVKHIHSKVGCAYLWGGQGESVYAMIKKVADSKGQSSANTDKMLSFLAEHGVKDLEFFDCSGLGVSFLLAAGAISYDMTADGLYRKCTKIDKEDARPSDMVFLLNTSGKATHVGYVAEGGVAIHALNQSRGVIEEPLLKRKWVYGRPDFCVEYDLASEVEYFQKYTGTSGSLIDGLNAVGANTSMSYRKKIASANGIELYKGTAKQNTELLAKLKSGKLIKP